jgi:hypothetical protein
MVFEFLQPSTASGGGQAWSHEVQVEGEAEVRAGRGGGVRGARGGGAEAVEGGFRFTLIAGACLHTLHDFRFTLIGGAMS